MTKDKTPKPPKYKYGSAEQDEWHSFMDGPGTPDPGGRRNSAINGGCAMFFAVMAIMGATYLLLLWLTAGSK